MIVVPLGAHVGVFSVLPRLRSMILTSLPALSCQSPLPRSKRLTLLPWAASVPGAESKQTQVYHVYPTLGKPNSCCANVHCLGVFLLCLPSSSYRVWRFLCLFAIDVVVLRFSVVTFALYSVWVLFVSFGFCLGLFALCCANVCPLGIFFIWVCHRCHIAFLRRGMISLRERVA